MKIPIAILILCILFGSFVYFDLDEMDIKAVSKKGRQITNENLIDTNGMNIQTRVLLPNDYKRINASIGSYEEYLRNLPLKKTESEVMYFNGNIKYNDNVYCAVIDLDIGKKDLHQCADAVMRLKAEYLWKNKRYNEIHFNFTNGFRVDYSEWMKGKRMKVRGNKTHWVQKSKPSNTYNDFWEYMELIFMYAGTLSLSKELKSVEVNNMQIGDVFIQGGSPGHAVVVVDMAVNITTKEKIFLLAQSYMPAQDIQILINPNNKNTSPWYSDDFGTVIYTPEWTFYNDQLMRF